MVYKGLYVYIYIKKKWNMYSKTGIVPQSRYKKYKDHRLPIWLVLGCSTGLSLIHRNLLNFLFVCLIHKTYSAMRLKKNTMKTINVWNGFEQNHSAGAVQYNNKARSEYVRNPRPTFRRRRFSMPSLGDFSQVLITNFVQTFFCSLQKKKSTF